MIMRDSKAFATSLNDDNPTVVALILNWNLWELTVECIESLEASDYRHLEILVVDNGSINDSVERIREHKNIVRTRGGAAAQLPFRILRSAENLGYSGGNNLGLRRILSENRADYVLLLNNDVVLAPDAIRILVRNAMAHPEFALIGPKLLFFDKPTIVQCRGAKLSRPFVEMESLGFGETDRPDPEGAVPVDAVYGACLLVKASCLRTIGGLDETFRFYGEDIEWCLRASRMGFLVGCVPSAKVWHRSEASTRYLGKERRYHNGRGRAILLKKYVSPGIGILSVIMWLPKELARIIHNDRQVLPVLWYLRGFVGFYLSVSRNLTSLHPRSSLDDKVVEHKQSPIDDLSTNGKE